MFLDDVRQLRPFYRLLPWLASALGLYLLAYTVFQIATWPDVEALVRTNPGTTAFIERHKARREAEGKRPRVARTWVAYHAISPHLKCAVLAAEDMSFFDHDGFDVHEIEAAMRNAAEKGELPRGASTITQQLAKNLWLSPSYDPLRKIKEAMLTGEIEEHLSKRRILELYLNLVELGPGIYGAEAAARAYYGKSASALTEREAAELAASLPRPRSWNPQSKSKNYRKYVETILKRMQRAEYLRSRV